MALKCAEETEFGMRKMECPWPETIDDLREFILSLVNREHDYGTCVYAMSLAATAAFNFVARKLGTTSFQASMADLDVLRRTRQLEGPFILLDGANALYPQYDLPGKLEEVLKEWRPWLRERAQQLLAEHAGDEEQVHPEVLEHWKRLASEG